MHFPANRLSLVDFVMQWGLGWRHLCSSNFRRAVHGRWQHRNRALVIAELTFALLSFVIVNGFILIILWRIFVGPIASIYEWRM